MIVRPIASCQCHPAPVRRGRELTCPKHKPKHALLPLWCLSVSPRLSERAHPHASQHAHAPCFFTRPAVNLCSAGLSPPPAPAHQHATSHVLRRKAALVAPPSIHAALPPYPPLTTRASDLPTVLNTAHSAAASALRSTSTLTGLASRRMNECRGLKSLISTW